MIGGTVLKGHSLRNVENHWSRGIKLETTGTWQNLAFIIILVALVKIMHKSLTIILGQIAISHHHRDKFWVDKSSSQNNRL